MTDSPFLEAQRASITHQQRQVESTSIRFEVARHT